MKNFLWISSAIFILFTVAACNNSATIESQSIGDPELGREIFQDRYRTRCEGCHSLDGSEARGAPTMLGISETAGSRVPEMSASDYLQQSILDPSAYIVEGYEKKMPPYKVVKEVEVGQTGILTQEELNNLIAFLLTQ